MKKAVNGKPAENGKGCRTKCGSPLVSYLAIPLQDFHCSCFHVESFRMPVQNLMEGIFQ